MNEEETRLLESQRTESSKIWGYLSVIGGICMTLVNGNIYLWGNISGYVITYFHFGGDEVATKSIAVMMIPVGFTVQSCTAPFGAFLLKRYNPKIIIAVGSLVMCASILIASFMKTWWSFLIFYGVLFPAGIGIVNWPPTICGWEWFPENKGLVSGLIIGGYGFGAFIFGFISTAIINPNNEKADTETGYYPESVGLKFPGALRIMLIMWACLSLLAVLLVSRNPEFTKK